MKLTSQPPRKTRLSDRHYTPKYLVVLFIFLSFPLLNFTLFILFSKKLGSTHARTVQFTSRTVVVLKVMLHETIFNDDFERNIIALQIVIV